MSKVETFRKKDGTGSHSFVMNGKRVRVVSGQTVQCTAEQLGKQLKHYDCLTRGITEIIEEKRKPEVIIKDLKLVRVSRGLYNVINPDNPDKPLNDKPLKKAHAEVFLTNPAVKNE